MNRWTPEDNLDALQGRMNPERPRIENDLAGGVWVAVEAVEVDQNSTGRARSPRQQALVILYSKANARPPEYMVKCGDQVAIFDGVDGLDGVGALAQADAYSRRVYGVGLMTAAAIREGAAAQGHPGHDTQPATQAAPDDLARGGEADGSA